MTKDRIWLIDHVTCAAYDVIEHVWSVSIDVVSCSTNDLQHIQLTHYYTIQTQFANCNCIMPEQVKRDAYIGSSVCSFVLAITDRQTDRYRVAASVWLHSANRRYRRRHIWCSSSSELVIRRLWLSTVGERAFQVVSSCLWNSLQLEVTALDIFWKHPKIYLF